MYNSSLTVAGCDKVGRGCLAGSVVAAAVILSKVYQYTLLKDSKDCYPIMEVVEKYKTHTYTFLSGA
jgi:ribonuclease HII